MFSKRTDSVLALLIIFALMMLAGMLFYGAFVTIDPVIVRFQQGLEGFPRNLFRALTHLGRSEWILVPSGLLVLVLAWRAQAQSLLYNRTRYAHWTALPGFVFLSVAGAGILAQIFKQIVGRARPKYFDELGAVYFNPFSFSSDYASFPSGHATTVFAFATVLALLLPRARIWVYGMATVIASTRFLIGAHYLTDVIAGSVLGTGFPLILRTWFARQSWLFKSMGQGGYAFRSSLYLGRYKKQDI